LSKKKELQQQLEDVQNQLRSLSRELKEIKEILTLESKTRALEDDWHESREDMLSTSFFYSGILLGLVTGIVGNIFVELLFSELTPTTVIQLIASGSGLFILCAVLWREMQKHAKPPKDVRVAFRNEEKKRGS